MEHVTDFVSKTDGNWSDTARTKLSGDIIKLLSFGSDEQLEKDIGQAMEKYVDLSNSLDMNVLKFTNYGKTLVKSLQQSPDSWIQVAINWAYFRLHRHIGSCYEAAGMRKFQHGRTDIIRSVTSEMTNLYFSPSHESLLSAIASHNQLSKSVVNGNGVDRLMLGLQCVLEEIKNGTWKWGLDGDLMITDKDASDLKKLTNHNLYQRARHFNMSTSQVYSESSDSFCSYSPLVEDGYGCCYNPTSDGITFAVSAFNVGHSNCDVHKYSTELQATLCDMKDMFTKQ
ncbi:Carnitine O-acetyltransferase [Halotydeus destructor]|nr:Carnitine O-acetyltransferase [Halotydeus destructor]